MLVPSKQITGIHDSFSHDIVLPENPVLFCCTDSDDARIYASRIACEQSLPLIECGCSPNSLAVSTYAPSLTDSIEKQRNLSLSSSTKTEDNTSCIEQINPSLVMPNCIAGSLCALLGSKFPDDQKLTHILPSPLFYTPQTGFYTRDAL